MELGPRDRRPSYTSTTKEGRSDTVDLYLAPEADLIDAKLPLAVSCAATTLYRPRGRVVPVRPVVL